MRVYRPTSRRAASLLLAAALAVTASVAVPPTQTSASEPSLRTHDRVAGAHTESLPNYHARFDGAFQDQMVNKGRSGKRTAISAREKAAEVKLAGLVPSLHVERDEVSLFPVMVLSHEPGRMLTGTPKAGTSPESAARAFLRANRDLYGASLADLETLRLVYVTSPEGGATIAKFDQVVNGIQLFDTEIAVTMTKQNEVAATGGRFYPGVEAARRASSDFALQAPEAITRALFDLTGRQAAPADFAFKRDADGGYQIFEYVPDRAAGDRPFLSELARAKRVLFPVGGGAFEPGYYLELWVSGEPAGSGPVYSYVISARDGGMLFRSNLTASEAYTYRVYGDTTSPYRTWDGPTGTIGTHHPTGVPDGYQAPYVTANNIVVESLLGASDPWLPPSATVTTGNNTEAYADVTGADGFSTGDVRGATSAVGQFVYDYNHTLQPADATNRQAAVVNMFYQVNWQHDIWYQHGFNEVARNAQTDNYGRGGSGNDSVKAEGQDQSGTDNANMSTPADGGRPRMQMYRFRAGGRLDPERDGTFDMLIVGHELMHYMSNRLVGNANGLSNNQGRSMGEGWSDWNAVLLTAQEGDFLDGTYAVGGYTDYLYCSSSFVDNYYYSIRRYPYSSNKLKNPLTFKDIGPGITTYPGVSGNPCQSLTGSPAQVHNSGEIWANALWEMYVGLAKAYGIPSARDKAMQYVIDGLKTTPSAPTYTQARDAVVAAANAANGFANPQDAQIIWRAFAKRGMGEGAVSPASSSTNHSGVTESFVAPNALPDDTFGVVVSGVFHLQTVMFPGQSDISYAYGAPGWIPIMGNWDGGSTVGAVSADNPGVYDPTTSVFHLRNSQTAGTADIAFQYGPAGSGWTPLAGDWNGDGVTTIGLYNPATGIFYLRNSNNAGVADLQFVYGPGGLGWLPTVGDWNGDGVDTIGLYDPSTGIFYLRNTNTSGVADLQFQFGAGGAGHLPTAGDWDSNGTDTIGLYNPTSTLFYFRNTNDAGPASQQFGYGPAGSVPVFGNFDGQ